MLAPSTAPVPKSLEGLDLTMLPRHMADAYPPNQLDPAVRSALTPRPLLHHLDCWMSSVHVAALLVPVHPCIGNR